MHYKEAKGILSQYNGMNVYRGCTHGCIYCDSRSKCYNMQHDFEEGMTSQGTAFLVVQLETKNGDYWSKRTK